MNDIVLLELTEDGWKIVDQKTFHDSDDPDQDAHDWAQQVAERTGKRLYVYAYETEVFPRGHNL